MGRMVRGPVGATMLLAAVMCGAALAGARDHARFNGTPGIAYYDSAAAASATSIVVRARGSADLDAISTHASALGYVAVRRADEPPAIELKPPADVSVERAVDALASLPGVAYAEPAYRVQLADVPTAPLYEQESAYLEKEHAPEAWDIEKGRASVVVAILDTGIDLSHPDLRSRIWTNTNEIDGNGVDDDGNGCIDDVHGCAFVVDPDDTCAAPVNGDVDDDLGHGTFVSGVIAASGTTSGMVGVARGVTIMPVKVLDCTGGGSSFALAQGILFAVKNGASLLNVSLGGPVDSAYIREAIRIARDDYGVLLVASTGNGGGDVSYPARYPEVLAVGAESSNAGHHASFSGAGPEVDVVAIGEGVVGTVPEASCGRFLVCMEDDDLHAKGDGTSFAAPQVTGLVALMLSHNRYLQPDQIIDIVKSTAEPLPGGEPLGWAGAGRINMLRALTPQYRLGVPGTTRGS